MSLTKPLPRTRYPQRPRERRSSEGTRLRAYTTSEGQEREIVASAGADASTLVIDRETRNGRDERLIARIAADERPQNAQLVCALYMAEPAERRYCRAVTPQDRDATAGSAPTRWIPGDAWTLVRERMGVLPAHPSHAGLT